MSSPEPGPAPVRALGQALLAPGLERDLVELTGRLVRAGGGNPPGGEAETVRVLAQECRDRGLEVRLDEVEPGRSNVRVRLPGGPGPGLLLLGHTDVVPVGEGWSDDPFGGTVDRGRLQGRGSADMKGGLAACVLAMVALRDAGVALSGPVDLVAVVDEEETGAGIRHFLRSEPDQYAGCVVAEPTDLQTVVAARGDAYLDVVVRGVQAHSGRPDDGRNAVHGLAEVITSCAQWHDELRERPHPLLGPATCSVGLVEGGTGTSTVPAEARLSLDRRLLPDEDGPGVLAGLRQRVAELGLDARGLEVQTQLVMSMPGFETPADAPLVDAARSAVVAAAGPDLPVGGWTAACDGGFVSRDLGVPTLVLGPGSVNDQAHRPDESVAVAELQVALGAYARTAVALLGG